VTGANKAKSTVSGAAVPRAHIITAIRDALPVALTPSDLNLAWRQSHLCPFLPIPPCGRDTAKYLRRERHECVRIEERTKPRQSIRLTGLVKTPEKVEFMKKFAKSGGILPAPFCGE